MNNEKPLSESAIAPNIGAGFVLDIDVLPGTTVSHHIDASLHPTISIVVRVHRDASLFIIVVGDISGECTIDRSIDIIGGNARVELRSLIRSSADARCSVSDDVHVKGSDAFCTIDNRIVAHDASRSIIRERVMVDQRVAGGEVSTAIRGMLLGDSASIRAIPELDIASNTIKARHAVSIARPSESMVSYCATRGMSRDEAMTMIANGFLCPAL